MLADMGAMYPQLPLAVTLFMSCSNCMLPLQHYRNLVLGAVAIVRWLCYPLWIMAEVAIAACDLAEVIGAAVALQLLFGLPLWAGVLITIADVILVMLLEGRGFRWLEIFVILLILFIFAWWVSSSARPGWFLYAAQETGRQSLGLSDRLWFVRAVVLSRCVCYNATLRIGGLCFVHVAFPF